jgi:hypothetical protein
MKLCKAKYELKTSLTTLYILQEKIEWITVFIHLYLLNILIHQLQVTNIMLHVTFLDCHPSYEQVTQLLEIFLPRI